VPVPRRATKITPGAGILLLLQRRYWKALLAGMAAAALVVVPTLRLVTIQQWVEGSTIALRVPWRAWWLASWTGMLTYRLTPPYGEALKRYQLTALAYATSVACARGTGALGTAASAAAFRASPQHHSHGPARACRAVRNLPGIDRWRHLHGCSSHYWFPGLRQTISVLGRVRLAGTYRIP
jgi:hypothetical protein